MHRWFTIAILTLLAGPALAVDCNLQSHQGLGHRPQADKGPTAVTVAMHINDIIEIRDAKQSFFADLFVRAYWNDPRLRHDGADSCFTPTDTVWTPGLQVLNRRMVDRIVDRGLEIFPDGKVVQVARAYGEFSFKADLSEFPFDSQEIGFDLASRFSEDEVAFQGSKELVSTASRLSVANWDIQLLDTRVLSEYVAPLDRDITRYDVVFSADRLSGFYLWQQLIPLFLVVMMTWVVFWIPQRHVPPRVGLAATAMLTLIAYRFAISSVLPPIAYLTRLDILMIGASIMVFGALATIVSLTWIADHKGEEVAERLNMYAVWLSPALFMVVLLAAYIA